MRWDKISEIIPAPGLSLVYNSAMRSLGVSILVVAAFLGFARDARAAQGDQLVGARLVADVSAIKPGQTFNLGILLKIQPDWHIYWKNPGDSGLATKLKLSLPAGFTSEPLEYPVPIRLDLPGEIVNYAYQDEVMLLERITAPKDLSTAAPVAITGKVNWLVCKESCVPGSAMVSLELPVSSDVSPANEELFEQWAGRLPVDRDAAHVVDISITKDVSQEKISIHWKNAPGEIQWFPISQEINLSNVKISTLQNTTEILYHLAPDTGKNPDLESVLAYTVDGKRIGLKIADHAT
jgi:DsbC/DsbD-like thiol-disulfide interchange protein